MACKLNSVKNEIKQGKKLIYELPFSSRSTTCILSGRIYVYLTDYSDDDKVTFLVEFRIGRFIADDFVRVLDNDGSNLANILLDIVEVCLERHYTLLSNVD